MLAISLFHAKKHANVASACAAAKALARSLTTEFLCVFAPYAPLREKTFPL